MTNTQAELRDTWTKALKPFIKEAERAKRMRDKHGQTVYGYAYSYNDLQNLAALASELFLLNYLTTVTRELTDDMLRDRISELEAALKPFANVAQKVLEQTDDHWDAYVTLNEMGNIDSFHRDVFRNASRALGGGHE